MREKSALTIISILTLLGVLFSGYMSYKEIFSGVCSAGGCSNLGGLPVCVYGFAVFLITFVFSLLGLAGEKTRLQQKSK